MKLSNASKRLLALSILALVLSVVLAPVAVVTAGPGDTTEPIPGTPPEGTSSTGTGTDALPMLLGLIIDVGAAVVL
jgi:hypothetical protein